jgi:hypothetical protein
MDGVSAPVDQLYEMAFGAQAVTVALAPMQIPVSSGIVTVRNGLTVTVVVAVAVQLLASVTITVYEVVAVGETVMLDPAPPGFHT